MTGSLVILTGAGISAESGLGTFRDTDGLWAKFDWQALATPEAFAAEPFKVHEFYNARRANLATARPHAAHAALARLERDWLARGGDFLLVTQNVDDLHEQAGSQRLVHMHGELKKMRCEACHTVATASDEIGTDTPCPRCRQPGFLRPHVVWFGEIPLEMDLIFQALESCTHFVAIGTSGTVYPAAGFSEIARRAGAHLTEINLAETDTSPVFDSHITGPASAAVPAWVEAFLAQG
ncbi:NAD-dependent deacylase [Maricaulis virginensis]|uniref:NAD-dependent protein deacylase n=1 Tax=Maricaulis virginensis TaxID=144022 RepID=A0A9W6INL5_9PROT|nr:NAD-dependent deacylase [Maricaulis virginensis]GLK52807.1 NAD-dependent protein deacylase [Maricaulis virginensis]